MFIVGWLIDHASVTPGIIGNNRNQGNISNSWEVRIRKAAIEMSNEDKDIEPASNTEALLKDVYSVFDEEKLKTTELLEKLNAIEDAPWSTYVYGRALDPRGLARILKPHHIKPKTIRFGKGIDETDKGYHRSDFEDAWERYLEIVPEPSVTGVTNETSVTSPTAYLF